MRIFLRMARLARNPPSDGRVKLLLAILAFCLFLVGIEWLFGWPDWLTLNRLPRGGLRF